MLGTTWVQEMIWLIGNDCCFEGAKKLLRERVPFLEYVLIYFNFAVNYICIFLCQRDRALGTDDSLQYFLEMSKNNPDGSSDMIIEPNFIDDLPSPRYIKSHLPLSYLPPTLVDNCKVVYVARNPKGSMRNWFYHCAC